MWYNWLRMTSLSVKQIKEQPVFTVAEIAEGLRVSDETIRRKIQIGELPAIQFKTGNRTTFRILAVDLIRWLGVKTAQQVFGIGSGLDLLEQAFAKLKVSDREALIELAVSSAKSKAPERALTGRTLSLEEIAVRFPEGRKSVTLAE
jgi:excisionase family DNA binding protein